MSSPAAKNPSHKWLWIGGLAAVVVVVGLLVYFFFFLVPPGSQAVTLHMSGFSSKGAIAPQSTRTMELSRAPDAPPGPESMWTMELSTAPSFTPDAPSAPGYIISFAPDYLKITLTKITVTVVLPVTIWTGSTVLPVTGGKIDVSSIVAELKLIPIGTVTAITCTFQSIALVKGSITGSFYNAANLGSLVNTTVVTKAASSYNAVTALGGAADYTSFVGGASEEMQISLSSSGTTFDVTTACNTVITATSTPSLTIVFDINRVLRFYSGKNTQGVNPSDPANKAYFFAHSLLGTFVGAFFGVAGSIQGYRTFFATTNATASISGWMTLIFDGSGKFLSGMLMPDDDNTLTISKGMITSYAVQGDGTATFSYNIAGGTVVGFKPVVTINDSTDLLAFSTTPAGLYSQPYTGQCYFQLSLVA